MLTKDFWNAKEKKGMKVLLRNGFRADVAGSARGNTTLCNVYGLFNEMGSVYTHDIVAYQDPTTGDWKRDIEFTKSQENCRRMAASMGW
jgi:hypothetical protein